MKYMRKKKKGKSYMQLAALPSYKLELCILGSSCRLTGLLTSVPIQHLSRQQFSLSAQYWKSTVKKLSHPTTSCPSSTPLRTCIHSQHLFLFESINILIAEYQYVSRTLNRESIAAERKRCPNYSQLMISSSHYTFISVLSVNELILW